MNSIEAQIKFLQDAQRIDGFVHEDLEEEEIDLLFNTSQQRYIDENLRRTNSGGSRFQLEQPDVDDLEYLIERDVELPLVLDIEKGYGYSVLPDNYMYLLNDRSAIITDCNNPFAYVTGESHYVSIPLPLSTKEESPYYTEFVLSLNGEIVFDISSLPSRYSDGLQNKEQIFEIKNLIIDHLRDSSNPLIKGVYWEVFGKLYSNSSLILSLSSSLPSVTLVVDGVTYTNDVVTVSDLTMLSGDVEYTKDNRSLKTEHVHSSMSKNAYTGTDYREPISTIAKNRIFVYFDKRFRPKSIILDYIRIPRKFNVFLNQTFEVRDSFQNRIIDLAVESFKNTTEKRLAYEMKLKDNELRKE